MTANGRGGTRSCARASVRTYSGGNTSERVPTTWQTLSRSPRSVVAVRKICSALRRWIAE